MQVHALVTPQDNDKNRKRRRSQCDIVNCKNRAEHICFMRVYCREYGCGKEICNDHLNKKVQKFKRNAFCLFLNCRDHYLCEDEDADAARRGYTYSLLITMIILFFVASLITWNEIRTKYEEGAGVDSPDNCMNSYYGCSAYGTASNY